MENASIHEELEPPRSVVDHPSRSNVKRVDRVEPKWDRLRKKFGEKFSEGATLPEKDIKSRSPKDINVQSLVLPIAFCSSNVVSSRTPNLMCDTTTNH